MTEQEKKELLESHKPSDPELAKVYEQNPPHIAEHLEYLAGEGVVGHLPDADYKQFIIRYLNDFGVVLRNLLHFELRIEKELQFMATKMGIDVAKEFKEDARKVAEQMEANERAIKEQLQNCGKKN